MPKKSLSVAAATAAVLAAPVPALSTAPPVGPLPPGPTARVEQPRGTAFAAALPKPSVAGGVWRIARRYDTNVVRQASERTTASGGVRVWFEAFAPGTTRVVFALTKGETAKAYATRTFAVRVTAGTCPANLLPLPANPLGPAVAAALASDPPTNRPQARSAAVAAADERGPQVTAQCGSKVADRTVVVHLTDRALLPSQSLAQRVVLVGRTGDGYRVWQRLR